MPSQFHEGLVTLFRNRPTFAPDLLVKELRAELPEYTEARIVSEDFTEVRPSEHRADAVIQLHRDAAVFGIVVEVQLRKDEDKGFAWPVYVACLRSRIRCPVCLLIVAPDHKVAEWARQPISLGGESRIVPWVLDPAKIPEILRPEQAREYPELAVLSAIAHGKDADVTKSAEIALVALDAMAALDTDSATLYSDLILGSLSEATRRALEAMEPQRREYISDFARRYYGEGEAAGKAAGRAEMALRLLSLRFGVLSDATQERVRRASSAELDALAERLLSAGTLNEALGELG